MAYRAEIEIGVKGAKQLQEFRKNLENANDVLRKVNDQNDVFGKPLQSLKIYRDNLKLAAENLDNVKAGIKGETEAVRNYLRAAGELNQFKERQNRLLDEEAQKLGLVTEKLKAYNAAAMPGRQPGGSMAGRYLRPGSAVARTQTASPFGPQPGVQFGSTTQFGPIGGPSSSVLGGQSSPIGERLNRSLQAAKELDEVYKSIDRIAEKQVAKENERVEALGRGTQEVVELANSYRDITGQTKTQKQVQNEIRRGILETKKAASDEARVRSRDYLDRLRLAEGLGKERRDALLLASREEETEKRINAVLERRKKQQQELEVAQRRRQRLTEDLALGAGFPLLFGGGAGAVGGGVLGAIAGGGKGGFGTQILFSAIGSQLDALAENAKELGAALNPLTANVDKVIEAAGTVNEESGRVAKELEELGFKEEALQIATQDLARIVGLDGVDALKEFGSATDELGKAINALVLNIQVGIAKILIAAANFTGTTEQREVRAAREKARGLIGSGEATPELEAAFKTATSSRDISGAFGAITEAERTIVREVQKIESERSARLQELVEGKKLQAVGQKDTSAPLELAIEKEKSRILQLNADLTNQRVFSAEKAIIFQRAALKLSQEGLSIEREAQIRQERSNAVQALENKRDAQIARNKDKETAAIAKQLRLSQQRTKEEQKAFDLVQRLQAQEQLTEVGSGPEAQRLQIQNQYLRTLETISRLKNQDYAVELQALALSIRTNQEANLQAKLERDRAAALQQAVAPLVSIREQQIQSIEKTKEYNRLIAEGVLPSEAKRITEFNTQAALLVEQKEKAIELVEVQILNAKTAGATTTELERQLQLLKDQKKAIEGEASKGPGKAAPEATPAEIIREQIGTLQEELDAMTNLGNIAVNVANSIGSAFSTAFQDVVSGSKSVQEGLADMFKSVAADFLKMAADIIAKQLMMIALQALLKALGAPVGGGGGGGGGGTTPPVTMPDAVALTAAEGAFVTGPTRALVGEGGEAEYIIPESKMRESMSRYSRGARGGSVIPETGASGASGEGGGTAVAAPIDVRYTVERINSVDYVTADQFQTGMRQAADQGAKQGEQQTLKRLQMSSSTRKRIGM